MTLPRASIIRDEGDHTNLWMRVPNFHLLPQPDIRVVHPKMFVDQATDERTYHEAHIVFPVGGRANEYMDVGDALDFHKLLRQAIDLAQQLNRRPIE